MPAKDNLWVLITGASSWWAPELIAVMQPAALDGLLHYGRAPISGHSLGMNLTIWTEVVTAALALSTVLWLVADRLLLGSKARNA